MSLTVIGATSQIAQSTSKVFLDAGHDLLLVARDLDKLRESQLDQPSGRVRVDTLKGDISNLQSVELIAERVIKSLGKDPYVLIAVGSTGNGNQSRTSLSAAVQIVDVNFRNLIALISPIANALEQKKKGCLIIISSVAGDRGRQSNYIYGSAKAGLSTFAQGLRSRLFPCGVHVLTVKPGYVDTPMLRKALGKNYGRTPRILIGQPDKVGKRIYQAAIQRKNIIYVQPIWRLLMLVIRILPEEIFKRIRL